MFVSTKYGDFAGRSVDTGHCVRFCQVATPGLPHTSRWRKGRKVRGGNVEPGTVIATFGSQGRYANALDGSSHAAILIAEQDDGLLVWDQWVGHPVQRRVIRFRDGHGTAANDGDRFFVVES